MYANREFVDAGGLMFYGADEGERYRRVAYYIDRILKGSRPADLPIEQPAKFEFIINLKTAEQIGLTVPTSVLVRADNVIRRGKLILKLRSFAGIYPVPLFLSLLSLLFLLFL
jgi:putative tryptophan/tyrosine transport system substrate-binding protein